MGSNWAGPALANRNRDALAAGKLDFERIRLLGHPPATEEAIDTEGHAAVRLDYGPVRT
jgi:hypothetical protein